MGRVIAGVVLALGLMAGPALAGSITLFSDYDFHGERVTVRRDSDNFARFPPWNDRAASLIVNGGEWEVCKHAGYRDCRTLGPGTRIRDLGQIGSYRALSSARELDNRPSRGDDWGRDGRDWDRDGRGRGDGGIVWNDDRPSGGLSPCQRRVFDGFVDRFGPRVRPDFRGRPNDGTVEWRGQIWRFRCDDGRVNIWQ